jgi:transcriptional regulator with XRE-family HTH domain
MQMLVRNFTFQTTTSMHNIISIGRNIERIRKLKGIKQETLAAAIGISRQSISKLEQSSTLDGARLEQIASALGVSVHTIKNFNDDLNVHPDVFSQQHQNIHFSFNPWDKIIELYDALLACQQDKVEILKSVLKLK